jgi:molybdate transport system substrate-binding protein
LLYGSFTLARELTVFAASSLTEAFTGIATRFERRHPGTEVLLSFDGSATLATQITQGAPADVFASADMQQMQWVVDVGLSAGEPQLFASNRLVVITTEASTITDLKQLAEPGVLLVLAAPEVPVGNYAREALEKMDGVYGADFSERVLANLVSEEANVRQVALKVELGEADAAIVYATDAAATQNTRVLAIPGDLNVLGTYPIAALKESAQPELAQAFIDLVLSDEGQAILGKRGFQTLE